MLQNILRVSIYCLIEFVAHFEQKYQEKLRKTIGNMFCHCCYHCYQHTACVGVFW